MTSQLYIRLLSFEINVSGYFHIYENITGIVTLKSVIYPPVACMRTDRLCCSHYLKEFQLIIEESNETISEQ